MAGYQYRVIIYNLYRKDINFVDVDGFNDVLFKVHEQVLGAIPVPKPVIADGVPQ